MPELGEALVLKRPVNRHRALNQASLQRYAALPELEAELVQLAPSLQEEPELALAREPAQAAEEEPGPLRSWSLP